MKNSEENKAKNKRPVKSLRSKLLGVFIVYGLVLLLLLWIMLLGLMETYYKSSMERKCTKSMNAVSALYSNSETLEYEYFCDKLNDIASDNDIFFYVESTDQSFAISSVEGDRPGIFFQGGPNIISDARIMLESSPQQQISFVRSDASGGNVIVRASKITSKYRGPVYLYATASLTPLGPAVDIIRSQLLLVTFIVFVLGSVIAFATSKRLAKPLTDMSSEAKKLGTGNFDVNFQGADYLEINELADTLNDAATELKASDDLQKDLMANVSHDLRTPLTMIKSYAEMIRDLSGDNKEKREEHLGVIIEETDRLADLVGDILQLSKVQSGVEVFDFKLFDLQKAAEDIFQTYRIMESEGFTMSFETIEGPAVVCGDEGKIKQVIANLVSNAIKYSDSSRFVRLYFEKHNNKIRLCVEDHGIGIPENQVKMIWDRYQRASQRSARSKDGTGLGLSICSEILKRHSAGYGVASRLSEGSTFWFEMKMENKLKNT